jgi:hypothetical protein
MPGKTSVDQFQLARPAGRIEENWPERRRIQRADAVGKAARSFAESCCAELWVTFTMALVDFERFAGREVERVYLAGRLPEAKRVERTLSDRGIDYAVEIESFRTNLLGFLPREYEGVAFYVLSGQASLCRQILESVGLSVGIVDEDS